MSARRVRIEQFDQDILVEDGDTILSSALAAGIDYPFLCQQGQCGSCKSYLISGSVDLGSFYNPMVLTEHERSRGLILACQAQPLEDCVVSVAELDGEVSHVVREITCSVVAVAHPASDITVIQLRNDSGQPFIFSAGQYAHLTFPGLPAREYSMANRPDVDLLEFHIRHLPGGRVSSYAATELAAGTAVTLRGPFGTAYLREEHLGPILLGAAGSGLAPIQSIAETALANGLKQRLHLYFGVRDRPNLYQQERLAELARRYSKLSITVALSEPSGAHDLRVGHLSSVIAADFDDLTDYHVYLAGPPAFCEAAQGVVLERGVTPASCFMDPFVTNK